MKPSDALRMASAVALFVMAGACTRVAPVSRLPTDHPQQWSNVRVTEGEDPHAYGVAVEIWKHNGELIGFLSEYVGPGFDPPVGRLENIVFDENTGTISFVTKLSVGANPSASGRELVYDKNLYEFAGVIESAKLKGLLHRKLVKGTAVDFTTINESQDSVVLTLRVKADHPSFEQWTATWNMIVGIRGPKW